MTHCCVPHDPTVRTMTHCNSAYCNTLQHTATHCHTLPHTATHCNTVQHTATHCHTLQHTATVRTMPHYYMCCRLGLADLQDRTCRSVLQCVAVGCSATTNVCCRFDLADLQDRMCCSVLQCFAVLRQICVVDSVLQICKTECRSVLQCVAVGCNAATNIYMVICVSPQNLIEFDMQVFVKKTLQK